MAALNGEQAEKLFGVNEFETIYPFNESDRTGPCMVRIGKKAAGRLLDSRTWDGIPQGEGATIA